MKYFGWLVAVALGASVLLPSCLSYDDDDGPSPYEQAERDSLQAIQDSILQAEQDSLARLDSLEQVRLDSLALVAQDSLLTVVFDTLANGTIVVHRDTAGLVLSRVVFSPTFTYLMDGYVTVNENDTLHIMPGTVIRFKPGAGLLVQRLGRLEAGGTQALPIVFTAEADIDLASDNDLPGELRDHRGLWRGIVWCGNAPVLGSSEPHHDWVTSNHEYGGPDATHDAGYMHYCSIRHAGANNSSGLVLAGLGSGTSIHHLEVVWSRGNAVVVAGGSVPLSHFAVGYPSHNAFTFRDSYRGAAQFLFSLLKEGGQSALQVYTHASIPSATPSSPIVYNATFIGEHHASFGTAISNVGTHHYWGGAGQVHKSLLLNFKQAHEVQHSTTGRPSSFATLDGGWGTNRMGFRANHYGIIGGADRIILGRFNQPDFEEVTDPDRVDSLELALVVHSEPGNYYNANTETYAFQRYFWRPSLQNAGSPTPLVEAGTDEYAIRPRPTGPAASNSAPVVISVPGITATAYAGAFAPSGPLWTDGWTYLYQTGKVR